MTTKPQAAAVANIGAAKKAAEPIALGSNITGLLDGDVLTLRINLKERLGKSSSGKSTIVATTGGNQTVPGTTVVIGINAYVKG